MKRPIRAKYVGYTSETENHGDEALMWIIKELLAPEIEVVFDGDDHDIALLGGGTLINQSPWLIEHYRNMLKRSRFGGLVFGTGVGDTTFWGNHFGEWNNLLREIKFIGVRGPRSEELLRENGTTHGEFIGDPYLSIRPPMEPAPRPGSIGINFGSTNDSLFGGNEKDYLEFLHEVVGRLMKQGWTPILISVWSKDLPLAIAMQERLGLPSSSIYDARSQSLETLARLASCEVFVGEKLHACAMAAICNVPFIALEYQPKVRDFCESIGMEQYTVSTADRDPDGLVGMITGLAANHGPVRAHLAVQVEINRNRIIQFAHRVRQHYSSIEDPGSPEG